jgi:hypothetical protein
MVSVNSLSPLNTAVFNYSRPILSNDTIGKLKELGINISSISSEAQAKRIIEEKTNSKENVNTSPQIDERLEKIYQRIKTLAMKIDVSFTSGEKIETVLNKINAKIALFTENKDNANISAIRAEYDSIKYSYEAIAISEAASYTGLDILGQTNRAIMGVKYGK